MRSFVKALRIDLFRSVCSSRFLIAVLCYALFLCVNLPKETWPSNVMYLFRLSCSYGFYVFFFLCAAIPYATSFLADTENHYLQLLLKQVPPAAYSFSRCIAVAVSGFLAISAAMGLLLLFLCLQYPFQTADTISYSGWASLIEVGNPVSYLLINVWLTGATGSVFAVLALVFSTRVKNSFVVLSFPVLLYYLASVLATTLKLPVWMDISVMLYVPVDSGNLPRSLLYVSSFLLVLFMIACFIFTWQIRRLRNNGCSS